MTTPAESDGVASPSRRIAVVGAGYVGIPTAVMLAHFGHHVIVAERDPVRLSALQSGNSPIMEEGLSALLRSTLASGRLTVVADAAVAAANADIVMLCVATPIGTDGRADLTQIDDTVAQIRDSLGEHAIVVNRSTVPVGTAERVTKLLGRPSIRVVSNPEFLREGAGVSDSFQPDRTIIGSDDPEAARIIGELFAPTRAPVHYTSSRTAELIKYASNAFLATKISFINSLARLCDEVGSDVDELSYGLGMDPRIGFLSLRPGPGWGGSCLPKDMSALESIASDARVEMPMLRAAIEANHVQQAYVVDQVRELAGGSLQGVNIGVLGLTFKAKTADRRDSPALVITAALMDQGAQVRAFDPTVTVGSTDGDLAHLVITASVQDAVAHADVIVVLTEWSEFENLNFDDLAGFVRQRNLYDARGVINVSAARAAGFRVSVLGRS